MLGHRYSGRTLLRELVLVALAAVWWLPFYLLFVNSVKSPDATAASPLGVPSDPDFGVYSTAWQGSGSGTLGHSLVSSIIITAGSVVAMIAIGSVASYVIARRGGRLGSVLYILFVAAIMLPVQLAVIPLYAAFRHLDLVGNYLGMIILWTGLLMPLSVFLYTGFIRQLPRDYEEAARVDGATQLRTFWRVVFPLLRPVTGTVAILTGVIVWNDFFLPLVFLGGTSRVTLPVAVYSFVGTYQTQWNLIFAAVTVSVVPILAFYLVAQRQLIKGFSGGIKT
jgi:raffinose/stachyose/melibiose transport system permease protein